MPPWRTDASGGWPESFPEIRKRLTRRWAIVAADLTRQLLAYAGKGRFVVRNADVSAVIRDIAKLFRASAPKDVEVRLDLARDLPMVNADVPRYSNW